MEEIAAWSKAMELVDTIYDLIDKLPPKENWALADQMRRAVISIPSNISEGQARNSTKDFLRFLYIARGSKAELKTQVIICEHRKYISETECKHILRCIDAFGIVLNRTINRVIEQDKMVQEMK